MRRGPVALALLTLAALIGVGVQADPVERVEHFAANEPASIAHAGAQGHAPDNTLPAFEKAVELGADTLEMDLQITADGELVVIHDGTVDRTTDGSGAVADMTVEELQALDAGYTWTDAEGQTPFRGQGVQIPTLAEIVAAFPDAYLLVEMKTDGGPAIIDALAAAITDHDLAGRVAVASFSLDYLEQFRPQHPRVPTNMPEDESRAFYTLALLGADRWWNPPGELLQVPVTHEGLQVISPGFVAAAERRGTDVQVWTINDSRDMHWLLNTGVHGLITDYPDRLGTVLEERQRAASERADADAHPGLGVVHRLQDAPAWVTDLARAITVLGDEEFYLLVFPLLYWSIHRRIGLVLGVALLISAGLNEALKVAGGTPRPSFVDPAAGLLHETSFGLPSGHAQNGVVVWGLLAAELRRRWAIAAAAVLALALGWSRLQLGVHFPVDTLVGWALGGAVLAAVLAVQFRWAGWWRDQSPRRHLLLVVGLALGLVLLGVAARLLAWGWLPPATWVGVDPAAPAVGLSGVVTPAGALLGFTAGAIWLARWSGFDTAGALWRRALRFPIGLVGVLVLAEGLGAAFPTGDDPIALLYRGLRYTLIGAWIGGGAPWVFVRLGLAGAAPPAQATTASARRPATSAGE